MISLEHVTKRYGDKIGVEDLTFRVERGEIVGLLGPNGAGKTTTMRMIAGYMPPTSGSVQVAGIDVVDEPLEAKRRVGYLPETPPLYGEMTVMGFLHFVAEAKGVPRRQRRAHLDEVVERTGLTGVTGRLVANLSKGYKQRVGLAQALVGNPEVLILDEPTVGLDPRQIIEIRELIKSLGRERTVMLSSHILPEVAAVCGRVIIINRGRLVAQDSPENLSAGLAGARRLYLRVRGPRAEVLRTLEGVAGVRRVQEATPTGDGAGAAGAAPPAPAGEVQTVVVEAARAEGDRSGAVEEAIFFALAARGYPLLEMRPERLTLEEIFLQLVTEEPGADQADQTLDEAVGA